MRRAVGLEEIERLVRIEERSIARDESEGREEVGKMPSFNDRNLFESRTESIKYELDNCG